MAEIVIEQAPVIEGADQVEVAGRGERGMTTAEYAVGIIAACTLAGVLILVLKEPAFQQLMGQLIGDILKNFLKVK
ncbi:DUF4244 domain-containing protein [Mariniluteicoccus flavus]